MFPCLTGATLGLGSWLGLPGGYFICSWLGSCSISNDRLDLTVLAEKKAARASSLERLSFLGRKCLFTFSPYSEHRVLSLRAQPQ